MGKSMNTSDNREEILKELKRQNLGSKPKLSEKREKSFNFAAFIMPVIYNIVYGRYFLALIFLGLTALPHIIDKYTYASTYKSLVIYISIFTVILALFSGVTGNKAAYNARNYRDEEEFIKTQRFWIPFIILAIIAHAIIIPLQINGHCNTERMLSLFEAKQELKRTIKVFSKQGFKLGDNVLGESIPYLFQEYLQREHDTDIIKSKSGRNYKIIGYYQDCGSRAQNTYHGEKTACAKVYLDVNGDKAPNAAASKENADGIEGIRNNTSRLNDTFVLYIYNDDLAPKEGSIEEYAFKKFERK